jgi:hypothetical protein
MARIAVHIPEACWSSKKRMTQRFEGMVNDQFRRAKREGIALVKR